MKMVWHGQAFRVRRESKGQTPSRKKKIVHQLTVPVDMAGEIPADALFKPTLQHNGDLLYERQV